MKRLKNLAAGMLVVILVVSGTTALADTAYNTIDGTIDTNLEVVNFAAGATAAQTVTLRLTADSTYGETDPLNGCNLGGNMNDATLWQGGKTGSPALKLTATSSSPGVATVTSPAAFTRCWEGAGSQQTLSVTPVGPGSTTVTFAIDNDASKWRKNSNVQLSTASFTVNVAAPADPCVTATVPAAPVFSAGAPDGDNSWFKTVPSAAATSTTATAAISYSTDGATFSSTVPTLTEGTTTVTAKAAASTCASKFSTTARTFKIDTIAPSITDGGATTSANDDGWYKTAVTNTFDASDGGSGLADCTASFTKSSGATEEGNAVEIASGACSDLAGNTNSGIESAGFKIDMTAPSITDDGPTTDPNDDGWYKIAVTNTFDASDDGSGLADCDSSFTKSSGTQEGNAVKIASGACSDLAGNTNAGIDSAAFQIDMTAPSITDAGPTTQPNANDWYKNAVTNTFEASDDGSGLADCDSSFTKSSGANEEGGAVTIASGPCSDLAGNTNTGIDSAAFQIDMTAPGNLAFVGGPAAGASYYFGAVPAAPTCTADDTLSLLDEDGCTVSGYSSAVGSHTLTASATDNAGNLATADRSYSVLAWTVSGFYSPVDMNNVVNVAKAGSTVPLKFEIFSGTTELTDVAAVDSFKVAKQPSCSGTTTEDPIELYSTGSTSLRYDTAGGQFIQNWKIPSGANTCYRVTMTADDGSSKTALFKTK